MTRGGDVIDPEGGELLYWFLAQLEEAWDEQTSSGAQVLGDRYVQWRGFDFGLQIECSSNVFLTGKARLHASQIAKLRALGWNDPAGDELPNHWQVFLNREDLVDAAVALVAAAEVLEAWPHPPLPPVPTPDPTGAAKPIVAETPGRRVAVVPAPFVQGDQVEVASRGVRDALGPCVVVDVFDPAGAITRGAASRNFKDIARDSQPLREPLLAALDFTWIPGALEHDTREMSRVLDRTLTVQKSGRDCVLVLPPLSWDNRWLYASSLQTADVVVFVLPSAGHGPGDWAILRDVYRALGECLAVFGVADRPFEYLRPAAAGMTALIDEWQPEVQCGALSVLVGRVWDSSAEGWPPTEIRQAVLDAQLTPVTARLERLGRRALRCSHEVKEALDILGLLLRAVEDNLEHVQDVGFRALGDSLQLFDLLADAGSRDLAGVDLAAPVLRWLSGCGVPDTAPIRYAYEQIIDPEEDDWPPSPDIDPSAGPPHDDPQLPSIPWSRKDFVRLLAVGNRGTLTALAMMGDLTPYGGVRFSEIAEAAGLSSAQLRSHLAGLSRTVKQRFGRSNWPFFIEWDASEKQMHYFFDDDQHENFRAATCSDAQGRDADGRLGSS